MTNAPTPASASSGSSGSTSEAAAEQGRAVAGTAADQARGVADTAKQQASAVSDQAIGQAWTVVESATGEVREQLDSRLADLARTARQTSEELQALCDGRPDDAGRTREVAERAGQQIGHLADRADELGVEGVVTEVGNFARRRPVVFLAGAAAAGVLVGRLARAGQQGRSGADEDGSGAGSATSTPSAGSLGAPASGEVATASSAVDPATGGPLPPPAPSPDPGLSPDAASSPPPVPTPEAPPAAPPGQTAGWQGR